MNKLTPTQIEAYNLINKDKRSSLGTLPLKESTDIKVGDVIIDTDGIIPVIAGSKPSIPGSRHLVIKTITYKPD